MSLNNFIPADVMGAFILERLEKVLVAGNVVNTDYQGLITQQGDSVKIPSMGDIDTSDYTNNETLSYGNVDSAGQILNIDQAKKFVKQVSLVDSKQAAALIIPEVARRGAFEIAKDVDTYILQTIMPSGALTVGGTGTSALGTSSTPVNVNISESTTSGVIGYVGRLSQRLDEADVDQEGRFLVCPPWFHNYLVQNKVLETDGSVSAEDAYTNGRVGRVMGFDVRVSNNLTNASAAGSHIFAGTVSSVTFAGNLIDSQVIDLESKFGTGIRGLYIYGAKTVLGEATAFGVISQV